LAAIKGRDVPIDIIQDAQHWHRRAGEMRRLAEMVKGPEARETMLRIAVHYDTLAQRAEQESAPRPALTPMTSSSTGMPAWLPR
jgi:hypothetical protein